MFLVEKCARETTNLVKSRTMKKLLRYFLLAGISLSLLNSTDAMAQQQRGQRGQRGQGGQTGQQDAQQGARQRQGGNFDPAQMQQRMMDNYKEQFGVADDGEWKIIAAAITKVMEARREVGSGRGGGAVGMTRRTPQGDTATQDANASQNRQRGGSSVLPEAEELQKAIASNASKDEIKSKMAAYRTARQAKQAALDAAMDELKKLLSSKQEAIALMSGLVR